MSGQRAYLEGILCTAHTCAVFGGKNSNENIGLPVRWASASLSLICILDGSFLDFGASALDMSVMLEASVFHQAQTTRIMKAFTTPGI